MPRATITRYTVDDLVEARKTAFRMKQNTLDSRDPKHNELVLKVDIRRADSENIDLTLEFYGRVVKKPLSGVAPAQYPSASLLWHGKRIRGIDHTLKHPVVESGIIKGHIRGWHEHYWTDADGDDAIREPNPPVKNFDVQAIIAWCSKQWNIEGVGETARLFNE